VRDLLGHPMVQGGLAPFLAGLAAALVLAPVRLSGLAAACGFFSAVYLTGHLGLEKKLLLVSAAAAGVGALCDLAFRPGRAMGVVLAIGFGLACFWIFLDTLGGMRAQRLVLYAVGIGVLVAAIVSFAFLSHDEPSRAGAAGVALGAASGVLAWMGGAKLFALWGFGLAAGSAGFLLVALLLRRSVAAGASLALSVGVTGGALIVAVALQRRLGWQYAALLALVPLAVRLPLPAASAAGQTLVALVYALAAAGGVCALITLR
jgi:hypothetical protein